MNRETWFRILQVAVVAPFIYTLSDEEKNSYFKLGLKLVAGAIIIMNVPSKTIDRSRRTNESECG